MNYSFESNSYQFLAQPLFCLIIQPSKGIIMEIKFKKHYVTNGMEKARVWYSAGVLNNGKMAVTLYAKSYEDGNKLQNILPETFEDDSDIRSDYMEKGRARIYEGSPLYTAALEMAKKG